MGKYKRVYLGVGSTILSLWLALTLVGLQIVSDGDKVCAGTLESPCVSYITVYNPTAKSVYIYNKEDVRLDFSPQIKSYELYVKYYGRWRFTNFTMETRFGNIPKDRLYVFVFPRYSVKEFKLVGYKEFPSDTVKWGFGIVEDDYLDPVWLNSCNTVVWNPDRTVVKGDSFFYLMNSSLFVEGKGMSFSFGNVDYDNVVKIGVECG